MPIAILDMNYFFVTLAPATSAGIRTPPASFKLSTLYINDDSEFYCGNDPIVTSCQTNQIYYVR